MQLFINERTLINHNNMKVLLFLFYYCFFHVGVNFLKIVNKLFLSLQVIYTNKTSNWNWIYILQFSACEYTIRFVIVDSRALNLLIGTSLLIGINYFNWKLLIYWSKFVNWNNMGVYSVSFRSFICSSLG